MSSIEGAISEYRRALDAGDETRIREVFAGVADGDIDAFLDQLDAAGLEVPDLQLDGDRIQAGLLDAGVLPGMSAQVSMIAAGSFAGFVRARARAMDIGTDTLVERADETGLLEDEADLALAHAYVRDVLAGDVPEVDPEPGVVAALARVLDAETSILQSIIGRG